MSAERRRRRDERRRGIPPGIPVSLIGHDPRGHPDRLAIDPLPRMRGDNPLTDTDRKHFLAALEAVERAMGQFSREGSVPDPADRVLVVSPVATISGGFEVAVMRRDDGFMGSLPAPTRAQVLEQVERFRRLPVLVVLPDNCLTVAGVGVSGNEPNSQSN
jgi:hypothetical protein